MSRNVKSTPGKCSILLILSLLLLMLATGCGRDSGKSQRASQDLTEIVTVGNGRSTVLEILEQSHEVEYRSLALGALVTGIDGQKSGSDAFWLYSVNDTMPTVAADKYVPAKGDTIKWRFTPSSR